VFRALADALRTASIVQAATDVGNEHAASVVVPLVAIAPSAAVIAGAFVMKAFTPGTSTAPGEVP
jgi:hypothetical protein